jgi:TonB family protein
MLKRNSTSILTVVAALTLFSVSSNTFAQSRLTAKANIIQPQPAVVVESDRIRDGLVGPVRRVRTEIVKLASLDGKLVEGKRALLEVVAYDLKGNKVENQYFPVAGGNLTGKEVYKYDDKGNISEMTLLNDDGSLVSRETYKYEFDFAGNWNKMTASVAVVDGGGKFTFEPSEITYRAIMYYLDENMVKMAQPAAQPTLSPAPASTSSTTVAKVIPDPKVADPVANKQPAVIPKSTGTLPPASSSKIDVTNSAEKTAIVSATPNGPVAGVESEPPPSAAASTPVPVNTTPAPRPILKPVSGGVLNGMALSLPPPGYPETAKRMRIAGTVAIDVVIDENGKVISAVASAGPVTLREAAVQAALRARFSPTKLSGQPVKVSGVINYKFALTQ